LTATSWLLLPLGVGPPDLRPGDDFSLAPAAPDGAFVHHADVHAQGLLSRVLIVLGEDFVAGFTR